MAPTRVLLADTDVRLMGSYREALWRQGFDVALATTGLDCVAKLRTFVPDVLVLDPSVPWGQGEGVLALMHEGIDVPQPPVLLLSTDNDPSALALAMRYPLCEHHRKPLPPELLVKHVRWMLETATPLGGFFG